MQRSGFGLDALRCQVLLLVVASCATVPPRGKDAQSSPDDRRIVKMEEIQIRAEPDPLTGLDTFDASDLLEKGNQLFDAQDFDRAVKVYDFLLKTFPTSELLVTALYNCGLALEHLGRPALALERFDRVRNEFSGSAHAKDARYRSSLSLAKLGRWGEVADNYWALRQEGGLSSMDDLEARVGMAVAFFMQEDYASAEKEFMSALRFHEERAKDEYLPAAYWVAQSRFYLGEINARYFERLELSSDALDPEIWKDQMADKLEDKCQYLLRAQNNLIRAIRAGHTGWATAAGFRIGSLYESLYEDMVDVPVPPGLSEEVQEYYRREVKEKLAILVSKAIQIYERSLEMAERVGEKNEWVDRTTKALDRMKVLALESIRGSSS